MVTRRHNWGEKRVYYHNAAGKLCSLPLEWTSLAPVDLFVQVSAGRAAFRVTDLLEVTRFLDTLRRKAADEAESVPGHEADV